MKPAREMQVMRLLLLLIIWALSGAMVLAQDAARVGLFGMVEQVAPLVVAGRTVSVPDGLPVISPLGRGQELAQGDTVAITAEVREGGLTAVRILEVYPIVGPVSEVEGDRAVIMGSAVHIPPDATVKAGRWVALSGFWSGQTVIPTNLRRVDGGGFAQLTGTVDADAFALAVGGSALRDVALPDAGFGTSVWMMSGTPVEGGLRLRLMSKGVFGNGVQLVLWQGHASLPVASQTYMIHGTGVIGRARDADMPAAGTLVVRCALAGRVVTAPPEDGAAEFEALGCATDIRAD